MEELFNKVGYVNYEEKKILLLKHEWKHYYYFLVEATNGEYRYPTYQEYFNFNKMIINNRVKTKTDNNDLIEDKMETKKVKIIPKIIYKGVPIVLTVAMIASCLTACHLGGDKEELVVNDDMSSYAVMDTTKISGIENVSGYLEVVNPSWDDLRECCQNTNLSDKYKNYIYEGIDNLQKNIPNLRLDVLYYNMKKLDVIEQDEETFYNNLMGHLDVSVSGWYDDKTTKIYINQEADDVKNTFMHEFFGHASNYLYIEKDNQNIESSIKLYNIYDDEGLNYKADEMFLDDGYSWEEARAEMVSVLAQNKSLKDITSYKLEVQELAILLNATGLNLADISNKGLSVLINALCDKGIDGFDLISNSDTFEDSIRSGSTSIDKEYWISENIRGFLEEYYRYLLESGYSVSEAISLIDNILTKSDVGLAENPGLIMVDSFNVYYEKESILDRLQRGEDISVVDMSFIPSSQTRKK